MTRWLVLIVLALTPLVAHAQDDDDEELFTDDIVVRAPTEAEELAESSDSVRVIDTGEVRTQSADMGTVLARAEGISVRRAGGLGSAARLCLHGVCDNGIRYFLDGVPLALAGFPNVQNVPVQFIERVDVYRGAVPVRLGTDALGGVIDLRRSTQYYRPRVGGSLQLGSWGTYRLAYEAGLRHDETGLYVGVETFYDHADNDYEVFIAKLPDARGRVSPGYVRLQHNAYEAYGIAVEAGVVGVSFADRLTLRGFVTEYDREVQHNPTMTRPYGEVMQGEVGVGALLRYQHAITDALSIDLYAGYTRRDMTFLDAARWIYNFRGERTGPRRGLRGEIGPAPRDQHVWEDAIPARLHLAWQVAPEHTVELSITPEAATRSGVDREDTDGRNSLSARRDLFTMVSALGYEVSLFDGVLENQVFFKDYVYLTASEEALPNNVFVERSHERHDVGFGDGLRVRIADWLFARGTYELATRLPEPYEVFGDGALIAPNLTLAPERSHNGTLELALDLRETPIGSIAATVSGFLRWRQDMIVLLGFDTDLSYKNVYEALVAGTDASVRWESPGRWVTLGANVTYLDDRNTSSEGTFAEFRGDRIPNRPWLFTNVSAQLRAQNLLGRDELVLSWYGRYTHEFFRTWESQGSLDLSEKLVPSQLAQDLALTYTVLGPPRVSTTLEITNLGDARLYDFFGVQRPGRSMFLKLTIAY